MKCNKLREIVAIIEVLIMSVGMPMLTFLVGAEMHTVAVVSSYIIAAVGLWLVYIKITKLKQKFNSLSVYRFLTEAMAFMFWMTVAFWGGYIIHAMVSLLITFMLGGCLLMVIFFKDKK